LFAVRYQVGTDGMSRPAREILTRMVQKFRKHLQSKFPREFANDKTAAVFKQTIIDSVKSVLPPVRRPGRPPQKTVTRAMEMRREGSDWKDIYADSAIRAELIKGIEPQRGSAATFDEKQNAKFDLSVAKSRLRSAVRSRLKRNKRHPSHPKSATAGVAGRF
jgi:hypothetical protein